MRRALPRIAAALGLCVALLPVAARADATVEGYPYFAKLLGGRDGYGDHHKKIVIRDMAVADNGDVIVVGTMRSNVFRVTSEITFEHSADKDGDSGFVLCMDPSGKWKWGVSTGAGDDSQTGSQALGVAVDESYAYVVGDFYGSLHFSRVKISLSPGDPADSDEERRTILDAATDFQDVIAAPPDALRAQGYVLKIRLTDGELDRATGIRTAHPTDETTATSSLRDVALHQGYVFVCGDVGNSNEDYVILGDKQSAYNVQNGFLAAKLLKNLQECHWIVYSDDKGMYTDDGNHRKSDATANGIAVDDAGNAYVCGAIGGGGGSGNNDPASIYGSEIDGSMFQILTGRNGGADWKGVQSWFLLKVDAGGNPLAINYDQDNWEDEDSENLDPFSIAHDVVLAGGRVYVGGTYSGFLSDMLLEDAVETIWSKRENHAEYNEDGFLVRCDTNLVADQIIEVGTIAQIQDMDPDPENTVMGGHADGVFSLTADTTNNRLYAVGRFGGPKSFFKVAADSSSAREMRTLGDEDAFMAAVDITPVEGEEGTEFAWEWVRQTAELDSYYPPPATHMYRTAIDLERGRIYCAGIFDPMGDNNSDGRDDRPMKLGTEAKLTRLSVTLSGQTDDFVSFLTAVDDEGNYFEQVLLEIVSPYAQAHISPGIGTFRYFKDSEITIEAPWAVYEGADAQGDPITAVAATPDERPADVTSYGTRNRCTGYTLGVGDKEESGYRYEGVLTRDSTIEFRWNREHKLTVTSVLDLPVGAGLGEEELATLGDPVPRTGINWITEGNEVRPQITGTAGTEVVGSEGLRRRFVLLAYDGEGDAPSSAPGFAVSEQRLQLGAEGQNYFLLEQPSTLTYHWREQYEVRVRAAKPQGADMPLVFVDDGDDATNRAGTGDFWYHHGSAVALGSRLESGDLQLTGWEYATTNYFPRNRFVPPSGNLGDHLVRQEVNGAAHWFRMIDSLEAPVAVYWDYNAKLYYVNAALGQPLDRSFFATAKINGPGGPTGDYLADWIDFSAAPEVYQADDENGAELTDEAMHVYDSVGRRSWLLQPGAAALKWQPKPGAPTAEPIYTKLHTGFPSPVQSRIAIYEREEELVLTESVQGVNNAVIIDKPTALADHRLTDFAATFTYHTSDAYESGGVLNPADGTSFNYGVVSDSWEAHEDGIEQGLAVSIVSYGTDHVIVRYNEEELAKKELPVYDRANDGDGAEVVIACSGKHVSVTFDGEVICDRLAIPDWLPAPDWRFAWGARCGGQYMRQAITDAYIHRLRGDLIPDYFGNPATLGDVYALPDPDPRRRHIADTPPVDLDPAEDDAFHAITDRFFFRPDPGATGTEAAALTSDALFSSGMAGWSVLLFSQSTFPDLAAVGDRNREKLFVRVVRTEALDADTTQPDWWDTDEADLLRFAESAEIGAKLTSVHDTAGLGTGYLFYDAQTANYNADIHDRDAVDGPIIPVNLKHFADPGTRELSADNDLVVVWHADDPDYTGEAASIQWPVRPVVYRQFHWPDDPVFGDPANARRIVIASRLGSDGKDAAGTIQFSFAPELYSDVQIYNQPDRTLPGFNPNEEHALIAPSFAQLDAASPPPAAYALRNDLNVSMALVNDYPDDDITLDMYTSDPYVLVKYTDINADEARMAVYRVEREDPNTTDTRLPADNQDYTFEYPMEAGEIVVPPYPLNLVIGANPINNTLNKDNPDYPDGTAYQDDDPNQRTWFVDHKGTGWAVSGEGLLIARYYYPFRTDFWLDIDRDGVADDAMAGDPVCWLPDFGPADNLPMRIDYPTTWPEDVPILKAGETLTYSGGEYRADHPDADGLPGIIGWSAAQIVYDDLNPTMAPGTDADEVKTNSTGWLVSPLDDRRVSLDPLPARFEPAAGNTTVNGSEYRFDELTASLQRRIFFDSLTKELGVRGYVNDRTLGDADLTAAPPAVYVLEPNILTSAERDELLTLDDDAAWTDAVNTLYALCLNPNGLATGGGGAFASESFLAGVRPHTDIEGNTDTDLAAPLRAFGPGLALVPNQAFLDPDQAFPDSYLTLAENNDESLGDAPVSMHIIKVSPQHRYRGAVKVIDPPNALDEKVVLRHTGDFGANTEDIVYQWFLREEDGTDQPLPATAIPDPWQLFRGGRGLHQIPLAGVGPVILRDNLVFCRYAHNNERSATDKAPDETTNWSGTDWDEYFPNRAYAVDGTAHTATGEWAGAGNSPTVDGDFLPQLIMGWVKRVLDAVNPYEARIRDFVNNESPATYSSIIRQAGPRYEGPVALNTDKDVIENHGLIELYATVFDRAMDLSIDLSQPANTPGVSSAILLAATRIAMLYEILADEAWCDAMDPTIGIGSDHVEYGSLASSLFCFANQKASLLDEELALLRGVDTSFARPVYNRLFWNFTKEQGEAAYTTNYAISDVTEDGFIDEDDAMKLFPQGHGDAWGHYLTALKVHYDLVRHKHFNWHARSELYNLMDIVIPVDYFDERHFARTAAAKARTGTQITKLTYRARYIDNPDGQWQGYTDADTDRAWGVTGWARRAGQGALFDWVAANAITPPEAVDGAEGLDDIDRASLPEIAEVSDALRGIQATYDGANEGLNPLGVHPDAVPFDIDPSQLIWMGAVWKTHFEQVGDRAKSALANARRAFDHANRQSQRLRHIADSTATLAEEADRQDLAFRNRLIEYFGTPYPEHIGAGKTYPAGYDGPDILLHMYVDSTKINTNMPAEARMEGDGSEDPSLAHFDFGKYIWNELPGDPSEADTIAEDLPSKYERTERLMKKKIKRFWSDIYSAQFGGDWFPLDAYHPDIEAITLPVTAEDYAYQAPENWGERAAVGKLQTLISELAVAESEFLRTKWEYFATVKDINYQWAALRTQADYQGLKLEIKDDLHEMMQYRDDVVYGLNMAGIALDSVRAVNEVIKNAAVSGLPKRSHYGFAGMAPVGLVTSDIADKVKAWWKVGSFAVFNAGKKAIDFSTVTEGYLRARDSLDFNRELDKLEVEHDVKMKLLDFNRSLGTEIGGYVQVFQQLERYQQLANEYRSALDEAYRLLEERAAWNKRLARRVQQNRTHDVTLRLYRNEALSKYHDAFDLAARYVYLAAKAYAYETNFDEHDAASAAGILDDIVHTRTLGAFEDGEPLVGVDGLADCLARLDGNYEVVKGQMGFDNPEIETGRISLRSECFRVKSGAEGDAAWRNTLEEFRVDNLWDVWEFRHYCRPPAAHDPDNPEPGLVIRFPTEIRFRYNLFGHQLGPMDHAYDPSRFATKIYGVGMWLTGYDHSAMAETPRVYLVPAGADVMTVPTSVDFTPRQWHVVNQRIPVPYPMSQADLDEPRYIPASDALNGSFSDIVRFSALRAYHDAGYFEETQITYDCRLIGRSVWNTQWLLIIPGGTLLHDSQEGLDRFIYGQPVNPDNPDGDRDGNGVTDIKLHFLTYSHPGG